ncbi:hypothetical protein [Asanoa iriomotensis]|uniref:hypothetical protein n=1 Tax=Asanoa iriomotensis TaxID=234613 RepID=UPI0031D403FB
MAGRGPIARRGTVARGGCTRRDLADRSRGGTAPGGLASGGGSAGVGGRTGGDGLTLQRRRFEGDRGEDLVGVLLAAPAGGQGELEVAAGLYRVVVGLRADALGVLAGLGQHFAGLGDDVAGLLLGEGDHLLHPGGVAVDCGPAAQHLVQAFRLGADHAQLDPHAGGAFRLR